MCLLKGLSEYNPFFIKNSVLMRRNDKKSEFNNIWIPLTNLDHL